MAYIQIHFVTLQVLVYLLQIQDELEKNPFDDKGKPARESAEQAIQNLQGYHRPLLMQLKSEYQSLSRPFVCPLVDPSVISAVKPQKDLSRPMFDPEGDGALVMPQISVSFLTFTNLLYYLFKAI